MNKKVYIGIMLVCFCFSCLFPVRLPAELQQYMISGIITDKNDESPLRDAEVRVTGDKEFSVKTDIFGYYQIENIDAGTYLEVTAHKDGVKISPSILRIASLSSNRTINFSSVSEKSEDNSRSKKVSQSATSQQNKNSENENVRTIAKPASGVSQSQREYVTAVNSLFASGQDLEKTSEQEPVPPSKTTFDLSGKVVYYVSGLVGVKVVVNDDRKLTTNTDINGYYSIKGLKSGQDYTVKFIRDGFTFDPPEYTIVNGNKNFTVNAEASVSKRKISGRITEGKNAIEGVSVKII
ncbi:MAG: hypothetical protein LBL00_00670, partial [Endomicrobium sp.]|nr:hypothetical protein [Endomicrobium sp.]